MSLCECGEKGAFAKPTQPLESYCSLPAARWKTYQLWQVFSSLPKVNKWSRNSSDQSCIQVISWDLFGAWNPSSVLDTSKSSHTSKGPQEHHPSGKYWSYMMYSKLSQVRILGFRRQEWARIWGDIRNMVRKRITMVSHHGHSASLSRGTQIFFWRLI